ncbi:IPT/TIG domain-containing protein [Rufibacter ruber]|uniref:IPT/TIG domain-containing protein n=1 Tax=Rufibacter ruber TaxID=1783499 RepID=UPI0008315282|nr:IPT/TIG domain-containing protein [Rufibacter ruber]
MMQRYLLLLALLFHFHLTFSQDFDFQKESIISTTISTPHDIAIDKAGNLYILEPFSVTVLNNTGKVLERIDIGKNSPLTNNASIALDNAGDIYAADLSCNCVTKFSIDGQPQQTFGSSSTNTGGILSIGSIIIDEQKNVFIADKTKNTVLKFNQSGTLIQQIGNSIATGGTLGAVADIGFDAQQNLYVLDDVEKLVHKFSPNGDVLGSFSFDQNGWGQANTGGLSLAVGKFGGIYLIFNKKILQFDSNGVFIKPIHHTGNNEDLLVGPHLKLALDETGNLYLLDGRPTPSSGQSKSYFKKFSPSGDLLQTFQFKKSFFIPTFDQQGNLYVYENNRMEILKYDATGNLLLKIKANIFPNDEYYSTTNHLAVDNSGNIYHLEHKENSLRIQKFSSSGSFLKSFKINLSTNVNDRIFYPGGISVNHAGIIRVHDLESKLIQQINPEGVLLEPLGTRGPWSEILNNINLLEFDGQGNAYTLSWPDSRIKKFTPSGEKVLEYYTGEVAPDVHPINFGVDNAGKVYIAFRHINKRLGLYRIFSSSGQLQKEVSEEKGSITPNKTGNTYVTRETDGTLAIFTYKDISLPNYITGKIYVDANNDCNKGELEYSLAGIIVSAEPGPRYAVTNEKGEYRLEVGVGRFTVKQLVPPDLMSQMQNICATPQTVYFSNLGNTKRGPDFGFQEVGKPFLTVNITSNRRRRCMENLTTVTYANKGFATAYQAKVTVQLPPQIHFISASIPHYIDAKGNYVFLVGDLNPNQSGTIFIRDKVSCDDPSIRGLTVCTKVWITPNNIYSPKPHWDNSYMGVLGKVTQEGQARFVISNKGVANMSDSLTYRVYQNLALSLTGKYKLATGDSLVLRFQTDSRVVRVEADQPQGHPHKTIASANLEMQKANVTGLPDVAMLAYQPDESEPEIAEECLPITDSFDPNDKQVVPVGLTPERYTPTNAPLKYTIRFQNTGNDVAYKVVVVDTLSSDLDLSTFKIGAVSHPYRLTVSGKERPILTFTFNNIMLPDSGTNQAGSNGAIQFSIKPKADLPEKHLIENYADIFFDFNEPVRTNTTQNRIYDLPPVIADQQLKASEIVASPAISSFSPIQSRIGTPVTITGKNFSAVAAENKVAFNGIAAQVLWASATEIKAIVPATAVSGKIKVVTPDGAVSSLEEFTVYQKPTITAITPNEAVPGEVVTITGNHFSPEARQDTVTFNGVAATVQEATLTYLKVQVPEAALKGKVEVKTLGGKVESQELFMVWHHPELSSFSPRAGKFGAEVLLTGSKFAPTAAGNQVFFNQIKAEVLESTGTTLKVKVPTGASSGKIKVVTENGNGSSTTNFTVYQPPILTRFAPAEGIIGAEVTLEGNHLTSELVESVMLGTLTCEILSIGANAVTIKIPTGAGSNKFIIQTKGGQVTSVGTYQVWPPPVISGFNLNRQRVGGNLSLQGTNFAPTAQRNTVNFNSLSAEVLQASESQLLVRVPAGATSGTVKVTTPGGTASKAFEVIPAPILTQILPAQGSVGTVVELKGDHFNTFGEQDTVMFGSIKALILSASETVLKVRVPRGATTGNVMVAGLGGRDTKSFTVEELTPDQSIQVYPNPSTGKFIVDFIKADFDVQSVKVFDSTGKQVYQTAVATTQTGQIEVNLQHHQAGLYLLIIETQRGKVLKRISIL